MATENPLWEQNLAYAARLDRTLIDNVFTEGVVDLASGGLAVSERAAGANMSVDIAAGVAVVEGDDQADQGKYLCRSTGVENRAIATADPNDPRIDLVIARVRDSNVTGTDDDWILEVLTGTPDPSPSAPAVPNTAIALAEVSVAASASSITDSDITDRRPQGSVGDQSKVTLTDKTGTSYTLALDDAGKVLRFTDASAVTVTVPTNANVAFPTGSVVEVYAAGAGGVTMQGDTGVTVRNAGTIGEFGTATLTKHDTDEWVATGALS